MDYRVEHLGPMTFLGVRKPVRREPGFYEAVWTEAFSPVAGELIPYSVDGALYGVTFAQGGEVFYLAGVLIDDSKAAPAGYASLTTEPANYVVSECGLASIGETYKAIYQDILPENGWADFLEGADWERYPVDFDSDSRLELFVSVESAR